MDNCKVAVFAQMECSAHARRLLCASQTRLKSCASWKISDSGVGGRARMLQVVERWSWESMEDMKVLVELSYNVGDSFDGS
jgi:hypothetical protein